MILKQHPFFVKIGEIHLCLYSWLRFFSHESCWFLRDVSCLFFWPLDSKEMKGESGGDIFFVQICFLKQSTRESIKYVDNDRDTFVDLFVSRFIQIGYLEFSRASGE